MHASPPAPPEDRPPGPAIAQAQAVEAGSFRDPDSRVFSDGERVFRALSGSGLEDFRLLEDSGLLAELVAAGSLVGTTVADEDVRAPELLDQQPAAVLRHERIPFVSYPYEWPFAMLRDAALLQLDLLERSLDHGLVLKDATPYNVQWHGARPVFIDVGSFERLREGEPWAGYRQFCTQFLNPLLLQSLRGIPFQPWLRGSLEGITPGDALRMLSLRDRLRRGVTTNVWLHARLERRYAARQAEVRRDVRGAGFSAELIRANAKRLRKLVARLDWQPAATAWSEYDRSGSYEAQEAEQKAAFVAEVAAQRRRRLVWDLGCNDGRFSRIAAEHADYVLAADADQPVLDRLYRDLHEAGDERILPLIVDLADPSPGLGWRGAERKPLLERGQPELVLCLALVHHLSIGRNVPLGEVVRWAASLGSEVVLEWVAREDPMVQRLLGGKREDAHPDYTTARFEEALHESFEVERSVPLASGTRVLHLAKPRRVTMRGRLSM